MKNKIAAFIEKNIPIFHQRRLESLTGLELDKVLMRKNPYLFKAKNINTAGGLVKAILDAHLSSQEETIFGAFLENVAIHASSIALGGIKSSTEGIDLEFTQGDKRYIVSIKSGPNWGNASQIKKMKDIKNNSVKADVSGSYWKILDKDGIEMPDDWAIAPRTYEKVKRLLDRLNVNGEYRPYTMVQK